MVLKDPSELSRFVVSEPPSRFKELRCGKASGRIVLDGDVPRQKLGRSVRLVILYRIAEARQRDDDLVVHYNSKLRDGGHLCVFTSAGDRQVRTVLLMGL
jgi:hypothetical protein